MGPRTLGTALTALATAAAGLLQASPAPVDAAAGPPLEQIRESVDYLTATYRVSTQEAVRRVALGADSAELSRRLATALPEQYAAAWLDQRDGVLVVAVTDTGRARQVVRTLPHRAEIRVVPARYSRRHLDRIRADAQAAAGYAGYAEVNQRANRVDVWTEQPAAVRAAVSQVGSGAVSVRVTEQGTPTACNPFECDPPFRAGLSLEMKTNPDEAPFYCTSAFNLIDERGDFYVTTAGHCISRAPNNPQYAYHNGRIVGLRGGSVVRDTANPLRDFALMPVFEDFFWLPPGQPRNLLRFHCGTPSPSTCFETLNSHRYRILDVADYSAMTVGNLVCMTGASPKLNLVRPQTRCGEITALANGAIQTNICAKRGDSGSPLFNQVTNTAFGIESQVLPPDDPDFGQCLPPGQQRTLYTPISAILPIAHDQTGRTLRVITGN